MAGLFIDVTGTPAPQGSKRGIPIKRKGGKMGVAVVESNHDKIETWRQDVRAAAEAEMKAVGWEMVPSGTLVYVKVNFRFARPKSHYGTGKNANRLKPSAPKDHTVKPDLDKLVRGVLDALTSAGVYVDDSQVVHINSSKGWAMRGTPAGASIAVYAERTP